METFVDLLPSLINDRSPILSNEVQLNWFSSCLSDSVSFCYKFFLKYNQGVLVVISVCYCLIFKFVLSSTLINGKSHWPSNLAFSQLPCYR